MIGLRPWRRRVPHDLALMDGATCLTIICILSRRHLYYLLVIPCLYQEEDTVTDFLVNIDNFVVCYSWQEIFLKLRTHLIYSIKIKLIHFSTKILLNLYKFIFLSLFIIPYALLFKRWISIYKING